jgi:hypothetical protein
MIDQSTHWPSGIRDTTEFPTIDINISATFREHLEAFLSMDGVGWNDYEDQRNASGQTVANSRMRTNRKMYERMGLIYKDDDKIRLSRLGLQMKNLRPQLEKEKESLLGDVRDTAIDILSRYQLRNPVDGPDLPVTCDVLPCVCIWDAMRQLDNKIHYEEMNRVILHVMKMSELPEAIDIIQSARRAYPSYSDATDDELNTALGTQVHTDQATARIAPWFSFAGWGGLIIEQNVDNEGFRHLVEDTIPQVDKVITDPPAYYSTDDKDEWWKYYIGTAAEKTDEATGLTDAASSEASQIDESQRLKTGKNILLYGVPGSGKSWTIEHEYIKKDSKVERLVFHPDYTYSDFVGQILPAVSDDGQVSYKFTPGPFTTIVRDAYRDPTTEYILIIEEINRGNAPAIFGEVFQLLDRKVEQTEGDDDRFPIGTSEYGITNANIAAEVYGDPTRKIRIPSNLSIIGTMNTSDQNVFTLDTAFQRRWDMRLIENSFEFVDPKLAEAEILDTGISWRVFCTEVNNIIIGNNLRMTSSEDKRLGTYFIHIADLTYDQRAEEHQEGEYHSLREKEISNTLSEDEQTRLSEMREAMKQNRRFPEKVVKYLWDDAFKFNRSDIFDTSSFQSLEAVIREFMKNKGINRFDIFKSEVVNAFTSPRE